MYVSRLRIIDGRSAGEIIQAILDRFDTDVELNFEERYLYDFLSLFSQALFKLYTFLSSNNQDARFLQGQEGLKSGWEYLNSFTDDSGEYRGATGFSCFSYEKQGGYRQNSQFLFGTAYQFL